VTENLVNFFIKDEHIKNVSTAYTSSTLINDNTSQ